MSFTPKLVLADFLINHGSFVELWALVLAWSCWLVMVVFFVGPVLYLILLFSLFFLLYLCEDWDFYFPSGLLEMSSEISLVLAALFLF